MLKKNNKKLKKILLQKKKISSKYKLGIKYCKKLIKIKGSVSIREIHKEISKYKKKIWIILLKKNLLELMFCNKYFDKR